MGKEMVKEYSIHLMEVSMEGSGRMGKGMAREQKSYLMEGSI